MRSEWGLLVSIGITVEFVLGGFCMILALTLALLRWWILGRVPAHFGASQVFAAMTGSCVAFGLFLFCMAAAADGFYPGITSVLAIALALTAAACIMTSIVFMAILWGKTLGR